MKLGVTSEVQRWNKHSRRKSQATSECKKFNQVVLGSLVGFTSYISRFSISNKIKVDGVTDETHKHNHALQAGDQEGAQSRF